MPDPDDDMPDGDLDRGLERCHNALPIDNAQARLAGVIVLLTCLERGNEVIDSKKRSTN